MLKKIINRLYKIAFNPPSFDKTIEFLVRNKKGLCMIDIGANEGQTVDWALHMFEQVEIYSFEPTRKLYADLEAKYENNSAVHLYNLALSNFNGETKLHTSSYSQTNSLHKPVMSMYKEFIGKSIYDRMNEQFEQNVDVVKLDDWYRNNIKFKKIDIIKIDTQGNDYNVLLGATELLKSNVDIVIVEIEYLEFYEGAVPFYKIFEFLLAHGFVVYSSYDNLRNNNGHLIESNFIFVKNSLLNATLNKKILD